MDTGSLSSLFGVTTPDPSSLGVLISAANNGITTSSGGSLTSPSSPNSDGSITQTERLFTTRSRWAFVNADQGGDRGTRALIQVMTNNPSTSIGRAGLPPSLMGSGSPLDQAVNYSSAPYGGYAEFILTRVHGALDEKLQITETFGDGEVVYYFGRQPIMFEMAGYLIDSQDNDWFVDWLNMYGHVMRGSQLAQNYELLKIVLPNMTLIGTMTHMSFDQDSQNDVQINFEFQFQVKQLVPTPVTAVGAPLSNSANQINWNTANSFLSQQGINSIKSQAGAALAVVQNPNSTVGEIGASLTGLGSGLAGGVSSLYGTSTPLSQAIDGVTNGINQATGSVINTVNDIFYSVEANLAGIRASLFSPIYGVLTSLTKLISNVAGDIAAVFNTLASPVANIVRDVTSIAGQALGILGIINAATDSVLGLNTFTETDVQIALGSLLDTAGCISTIPATATMMLRSLVNSGNISVNVGFLQNPPVASLSLSSGNLPSKVALLNSGPAPNAETGATL